MDKVEALNMLENLVKNKIQGEYGEKKFIKPWRTGTKSQQLPTRGNLKKNRGNN